MTERMGLGETEQLNATIAANLHDLGKPISYHLTGLNVAQYDTHRRAGSRARVHAAATGRERRAAHGRPTTAVSTMYERFDGTGLPGRISGKQIPLGARVLSLCDTYSDLTLNPRNLFRKALPRGGEQGPDRTRGHVVRPRFRRSSGAVGRGPDRPAGAGCGDDKPLVLIVEPDAEEATILELRLTAQGFDVKVTRTADQAVKAAEAGNVRFVLSEVELQPFDGFDLLQRLRRAQETQAVPFLFVAKNSDAAAVDRAFSLGRSGLTLW